MFLQHVQNLFAYRFFFVSFSLVSLIQECVYKTILLSDHAPVILSLLMLNFSSLPLPFRFQAKWLKSVELEEFLEGKITDYFSFNTNPTSALIKWEAFKAYIRGEIISYTRSKSKMHLSKLSTLKNKQKNCKTTYIIKMTFTNIRNFYY